jgi:hypothetical protein
MNRSIAESFAGSPQFPIQTPAVSGCEGFASRAHA